MKQLGILTILLLLGVGITSGPAVAELTASQSVPSLAAVGETVQLTVMLTYKGDNTAQAIVTPRLPTGVVTDTPEGRATELYPGSTESIRNPIRAVQSGTYTVISQIEYAEDGTWRELLLEAPFTAVGEIEPPPKEEITIVPGSETPVGETQVDETPVEEMPMGEAPSDEAPSSNDKPSAPA
jgi:hypothetical protein